MASRLIPTNREHSNDELLQPSAERLDISAGKSIDNQKPSSPPRISRKEC